MKKNKEHKIKKRYKYPNEINKEEKEKIKQKKKKIN